MLHTKHGVLSEDAPLDDGGESGGDGFDLGGAVLGPGGFCAALFGSGVVRSMKQRFFARTGILGGENLSAGNPDFYRITKKTVIRSPGGFQESRRRFLVERRFAVRLEFMTPMTRTRVTSIQSATS